MPHAVRATPVAPPRRRAAAAPTAESVVLNTQQLPPTSPTATAAAKAKKLPAAAVEATAAAFLAGFKALPGAVQWRVMEMIEAYEDALDAARLGAETTATPDEDGPQKVVSWEQVKADYETLHGVKLG